MSAVNEHDSMQARKLVITRHKSGAESFGRQIAEHSPKIDLLYMPVIEIKYLAFDAASINPQHAVITTSKQALRRVRQLSNTIYKIDKDQGIEDVQALIAHIVKTHNKAVPLVYLRGRDVSFDLAGALTQQGYTVTEICVYQAEATTKLSEAFVAALKAGQIAYVSFFSQRTAEIFEQLILGAQLQGLIESVSALCLSTQVVNSLTALPWQKRLCSEDKDRASMLELINTVYLD